MAIFDFLERPIKEVPKAARMTAQGSWQPIVNLTFDGEKNAGEIGTVRNYLLDHTRLTARAWQMYLDSEVTQNVVNKFISWVVGSGLKMKSEPVDLILKEHGITDEQIQKFTDSVEAKFKVFSESKIPDYGSRQVLGKIAHKVLLNAIVAGDVLVILRSTTDGRVNVELIDAHNVINPSFGNFHKRAKERGNVIIRGVELSPKKEHIAYYVRRKGKMQRVVAKSRTGGRLKAFLVYGLEYRLDNIRGIPLISAVMETIKKMDRYKEATVGSAEERQKIVLAIQHSRDSTGEDPYAQRISKSYNTANNSTEPPSTPVDVSNQVIATTNKQTINLPIGAELKALESKNELHFKEFFGTLFDLICATIGIPPEVAKSKYDSNYSASRAAIKDWEHTILVRRDDLSNQFYQNVYNLWLEISVSAGKVPAPSYIQGTLNDDWELKEAYQKARFVGAKVPEIDPLKEVNAVRAKLGELAKNVNLITLEDGTEEVDGGDYSANQRKFKKEMELADVEPEPALEPEPIED